MTLTLIFAAFAGIVHIGFFALESVLFSRPSVWRIFGLRNQADADAQRGIFLNQGWYNLAIAASMLTGVVLLARDAGSEAGAALVYSAAGVMVVAALVLLASTRGTLWRGAVAQGFAPAVAIVALLVAS